MEALEQVKARFARVVPIVSEVTADPDTRYGTAHDLMREMERICDCRVISTIKGAEPIGPQQLLDKMVVAKQCSDVHTTILSQIICCQFLQSCNIGSHLSVLKKLYRGKCGLMLQAMRQQMDRAVFTALEGGFFVWCVLPDRVGLMDFVRAAGEAKVAVVPGTTFLPDTAAPCSAVRLNFSAPSNQQITDGIERLGKVLDRFLR